MTLPWHTIHSWLDSENWKEVINSLPPEEQNSRNALQLSIAARGFKDLAYFARFFFPHHCKNDFCDMHHELFTLLNTPLQRNRRLAVAAPRGYAKTTLFTIWMIHAIVYHTEHYIVIFGHTEYEAKKRVSDIGKELAENTLLKEVFGTMVPKNFKPINKKRIITTTDIAIEAQSVGTAIRGLKYGSHRPTCIVLDDVEKLSNTYNEEQREKLRHWFYKDMMNSIETDATTNVHMIGTVLHPYSLLSIILKNPEWSTRRYQAVQSFSSRPDLWDDWKELLTDLHDPNHLQTAEEFYTANKKAMLEGTRVLWEQREPYVELMKQRAFGGEGPFRSEKQNDPYDPTRYTFNMNLARTFKVDNDHILTEHIADPIPLSSLQIITFHDPKNSDETGKLSGDYAAIAVVGISPSKQLFVLDCYLEKAPYSEQIAAAYSLQKKWPISQFWVEANNAQVALRTLYPLHGKDALIPPITPHIHKQTSNKKMRIDSLEPLISDGQLLFNQDLSHAVMEQFNLFPSTYDDAPDAVQGAVERLLKTHRPGISVSGVSLTPPEQRHSRFSGFRRRRR